MFLINNLFLGIGLAMDAFSVSLANGLQETKMSIRKICLIAGTFALFQIAMPLIGWIIVHTAVHYMQAISPFIPWVALGLLLYIGGSMALNSLNHHDENSPNTTKELTGILLFTQGIATSIDALSVGFTIADYNSILAIAASLIIGIVTFIICICGIIIGKKFGMKYASKAELLGGIILISIGIEIWVSGVFF